MPVNEIPVIITDRLVLRAFEQRDFEPYASMMTDPEITRHLGDGRPLSRSDAWRQVAMFLGHWTLRGYGLWAVEHRETGEFMGRIGCWKPEGWPDVEIGYTLGKPYWGRGFAREGARASLSYARDVLRFDRLISLIRPDNRASIRVAESLGAVREAEIDFLGGRSCIYAYRGEPPGSLQ